MTIRVEDTIVTGALKRAKRDMNQRVKAGLKEAAYRVALPRVKVTAVSVTAPYITVGATTKAPFITTKGPKVYDRIAGMFEFGGEVTSDIYPKRKQAIKTPWGPRASALRGPFVGKPMKIAAQHRIKRGIQEGLPRMADVAREEIVKAFGPLVTP